MAHKGLHQLAPFVPSVPSPSTVFPLLAPAIWASSLQAGFCLRAFALTVPNFQGLSKQPPWTVILSPCFNLPV